MLSTNLPCVYKIPVFPFCHSQVPGPVGMAPGRGQVRPLLLSPPHPAHKPRPPLGGRGAGAVVEEEVDWDTVLSETLGTEVPRNCLRCEGHTSHFTHITLHTSHISHTAHITLHTQHTSHFTHITLHTYHTSHISHSTHIMLRRMRAYAHHTKIPRGIHKLHTCTQTAAIPLTTHPDDTTAAKTYFMFLSPPPSLFSQFLTDHVIYVIPEDYEKWLEYHTLSNAHPK